MWGSQDWGELWFCLLPGLPILYVVFVGWPTHHLLRFWGTCELFWTWDKLCRWGTWLDQPTSYQYIRYKWVEFGNLRQPLLCHICRPITPAPLWTSPSRKWSAGQTLVADYLVNTWIPKFSCRSHSQNSSNLTDPRGRDFCVFATGVAAGSFTYIAYGVAFQTSRIAFCSGGVGATIWSPLLRIKSCSALKYNLEHVYICSSYIQWIAICYSNFFTSKKYY